MNYRNLLKHRQLTITCLAVTAFVMGCKSSAESDRKATAGQFDKVEKGTKREPDEVGLDPIARCQPMA